MSLEFTSFQVMLIGLLLVFGLMVMIAVVRYFYSQVVPTRTLALHQQDEKRHSVIKYPEADVFKLTPTFKLVGSIVALALMILAFGWTTYEKKTGIELYLVDTGDEIEMETPRTAEPPPPPPPPPAPQLVVAVPSDLPELETVVFEDQSISEETAIDVPPPVETVKESVPPPPPPPPPPPKEGEIFKVVEEQPTFPGCEHILDKQERAACAEERLMQFIYENIEYPAVARETGVEGVAVVQFVVEIDGSISNIKVVRDPGAGLGAEAARVVSLMPKWNPGKQRGRPVRVMFTLPVRFILE